MLPKNRDLIRKNTVNGFNTIMTTYGKLEQATSSTDAENLWSELTANITSFRRTLSKLEAHAYERIMERFSGSNARPSAPQPPAKLEKTNLQTISLDFEDEEDEMPRLDMEYPPLVKENNDKQNKHVDLGEVVERMPLSIKLRAGEKFIGKVVLSVSPLEFYVVKLDELKKLSELSSLLNKHHKQLKMTRLPDSACTIDTACLVWIEKKLHRAVIRMKGTKELQVYTVDLGRYYFVSRDQMFSIPRVVAHMAPPLAHHCTLAAVDSRNLDQEAIRRFKDKVMKTPHMSFVANGTMRRNYGELVEIEGEQRAQMSFFEFEKPIPEVLPRQSLAPQAFDSRLSLISDFDTITSQFEVSHMKGDSEGFPVLSNSMTYVWHPSTKTVESNVSDTSTTPYSEDSGFSSAPQF